MARKIPTHTMDHAIELYLAGKPVQEIRAATGVAHNTLARERSRRGIPPRDRITVPDGAIVRQYESGASEYALSRQYGISRQAIRRRLEAAGVHVRGTSEAGFVRAAQMTEDERRAQAAAAHKAARQRKVPHIELLRRALTNEASGGPQSDGEALLARLLNERGEHVTHQRAIGTSNVDLAVLPVAMEVLGGGFHSFKAKHAQRTPDILDAGWHLVRGWNYEGRSALGPGAADYLVAFFDEVRRNPPATSQYRVIAGNGELLTACGREDNEFPLVPPPRGLL